MNFWHGSFFLQGRKNWASKWNGLLFPSLCTCTFPGGRRTFTRDIVWKWMWRRRSEGGNGVPGRCKDVSSSLRASLLKGAVETGLCWESVPLNVMLLTLKIAQTIIYMFSLYEELTEQMSKAWACAMTPVVCVYPVHLGTKNLTKGVNTMKVKIMNSDSWCLILTESEQEYAVASILISNYSFEFRQQPLWVWNFHLELHWTNIPK